ncbi:30S ribosomal protein S2 [Anaerolineales bacterium HSG24]|nr:30S ribosomal protein S2 [Anaerolineales bacterium HSG24]
MSAPVVPMKALLEAGVHFGHRTRRWNPKMKQYIFTERNGIHIIDLQQTITHLNVAYEVVKDAVVKGGVILFVGTKKQAQDSIVAEAQRAGMPYVEQRWLGGTLTNWRTIRQRIDYLLDAEKLQARGEFSRLVKKEALLREREIARLNYRLGGLKDMRRPPNLVFVVDVRRDDIAIQEANKLGIPIIAMVDTNCNPDPVDYVIPSNDDAIRAVKLMVTTMANAVLEGQALLSSLQAEDEEDAEVGDEQYLGPSTLAKIKSVDISETDDSSSDSSSASQSGIRIVREQDLAIDEPTEADDSALPSLDSLAEELSLDSLAEDSPTGELSLDSLTEELSLDNLTEEFSILDAASDLVDDTANQE